MKNKTIIVFPSGARNKGRRKRKSKLREIVRNLKPKTMQQCNEPEPVIGRPHRQRDPIDGMEGRGIVTETYRQARPIDVWKEGNRRDS